MPNETEFFLNSLFDHYSKEDDCGIEIAVMGPDDAIRKGMFVRRNEIRESVEWAKNKNINDGESGSGSIYVTPALLKPHNNRRSSDKHFLSSGFVWCDCDNSDANFMLNHYIKNKALSPYYLVNTANTPRKRQHGYFKIFDGCDDRFGLRTFNEDLANFLRSDRAVINPTSLMRLPGFMNFPSRKKRAEGRIEELVTLQYFKDAKFYHAIEVGVLSGHGCDTQLAAPKANVDESFAYRSNKIKYVNKNAIKREITNLGFEGKVIDGRETYARDLILGRLIDFIGSNGTVPTVAELYSDVWSIFGSESYVDHSRPGRDEKFIRQKCIYTLNRFHHGEIKGLETLELVIATYNKKKSAINQNVAGNQVNDFKFGVSSTEIQPSNDNPFSSPYKWPDPKNIPTDLLPVASFDARFLPPNLTDFVSDAAERMQCPAEYIGIPIITALGANIGRKIVIRPKQNTNWTEVGNCWACIIGRPGAMKSPAINEALGFSNKLESVARATNADEMRQYEEEMEEYENSRKKALKDSQSFDEPKPEKPAFRRHICSDTTYEALGIIHSDNPFGVFAYRDEMASLIRQLAREEMAAARGFYLTGWGGSGSYTFDRIGRGHQHIPHVCISMLGSMQPGRLSDLIRSIKSGGGDDGLLQRFGLLVWPDQNPEWTNVDRGANTAARDKVWQLFQRLDKLTPFQVNAQYDEFDEVHFLRFDPEAQTVFDEWQGDLEKTLRNGSLSPALESHFSKYRKLVPSLALINHLTEEVVGPISKSAVLRALAFLEYLKTHAFRCYASSSLNEVAAAKALIRHAHKGDLQDGFTARDIYRKQWTSLSDREVVQAAIELLLDLDWLASAKISTSGRPTERFFINPKAKKV